MKKTLVMYYSYSGNTKKIATELAEKEACEIVEIKDIERPGKFKAYTSGCYAALKGIAWPIQPLGVNMAEYKLLILLSPVWAGKPTPAFYSVLGMLPHEKRVEVKMVSASGFSSCEDFVKDIVKCRGSRVVSFETIRA